MVCQADSHKDWRCIIFDWFWEHAVGFYIIALGLACCHADECISTDTEGGEAKLLFVSNAELRNALMTLGDRFGQRVSAHFQNMKFM